MAKKSSSKKDSTKSTKQSTKVEQNANKDLSNKNTLMYIGVGLVATLILVLTLVKVDYQIREPYIEIEKYTEEITVEDIDNPIEKEVCTQKPASVRIEDDRTFKEKSGNKDVCVGHFRVWNSEKTDGDWVYKYIFNINGKDFEMAPIKKFITAGFPVDFDFKKDDCKSNDVISGRYELIESPTTESCEYVIVYPDKTKTIEKEREIEKERIIKVQEPLWQNLLGINAEEKE